MKMNKTHCFVICAYKESEYLCECIESLKNQSIQSEILCTTSTPNDHIKKLCAEYDVKLVINNNQNGMAADWNFAYSQGNYDYITITHQDDIYEPVFLETTLELLAKSKKPLIVFTGSYEIRDNTIIKSNNLLRIKSLMSILWKIPYIKNSRFFTRRIFMFGNPICCPSVTFAKENIPGGTFFNEEYKNSCDWLAWIKIRDLKGDFLYSSKKLLGHRIHKESETTNRIGDNTRNIEDLKILQILAPKPVAGVIHYFYKKAQKSNK